MEEAGPPPGGEEEEYVDALGVITALERTCELEARLRQAIQDTHPLTTTLDWDFHAADREREGLLAIRCALRGPGCGRRGRAGGDAAADSRRRAFEGAAAPSCRTCLAWPCSAAVCRASASLKTCSSPDVTCRRWRHFRRRRRRRATQLLPASAPFHLCACSEQLEYLEDKLREYRFLEPAELENKVGAARAARAPPLLTPRASPGHPGLRTATNIAVWAGPLQHPALRLHVLPAFPLFSHALQAVLLGQLDGVRRELVEVAGRYAPHILFGQEVVREVLAFAQVGAGCAWVGEGCSRGPWPGLVHAASHGPVFPLCIMCCLGRGPGQEMHAAHQPLPCSLAAPSRQVSEEEEGEEGQPEGSQHPAGSGSAGSAEAAGEPSDVELLHAARRLRHQGSGSGSMGGFASEFEPEEEAPRAATVPGLQRRAAGEEYYEGQGGGGEPAALIPAVRRSVGGAGGLTRPPRYPTAAGKEQQAQQGQAGGKQRLAASPKQAAAAAPRGAVASPPSLHERHQMAHQQASPPSRSAFLQHQQGQVVAAHQRGYVQPPQARGGWEERERRLEAVAVPGAASAPGASSPGAAATVSALRSATAAAAARGGPASRAGADTYSFAPREAAPAGQAYASAGPSSYAPSSYAPSESAPSSRQSPYSARGNPPLGGG